MGGILESAVSRETFGCEKEDRRGRVRKQHNKELQETCGLEQMLLN
jgi:hypothetical protein